MSHYRTAYREAAAAAILTSPDFRGYARVSAWAQKVDPTQMPCFGVATPRETSARAGGGTVHRVTTVQIGARLAGGEDLEQMLDAISLAAEVAVLPALEPLSHIVELAQVSTSVDAGGERRIGTLIMDFSVTRFTDAGGQD